MRIPYMQSGRLCFIRCYAKQTAHSFYTFPTITAMLYHSILLLFGALQLTEGNNRCPEKWSYYHVGENEFCMKVFTSKEAMSRQKADAQCNKHNSHLVSLHSTKEENFMRALMAFESASASDQNFWIGLRCHHNVSYWPESKQMLPIDLQIKITSCIFSWSDMSGSGNYRNWVRGTLNDNQEAQKEKKECAAYSELSDGWVRAQCDTEKHHGYICKMKLGEEFHSTKRSSTGSSSTATPTTSPTDRQNGTKVFLIGGYPSQDSAETYVPDHPESELSSLSTAKLKVAGHCKVAGVLGGQIVAAGGIISNGHPISTETQQFIPTQNRWKIVEGLNMLWESRCAAYATHNDMLYSLGGCNSAYKAAYSSSQRLNWARKRWEPIMHMKNKRCHGTATTFNGEIYVAGGWSLWPVSIPTMEKYSPQSDAWKELEPMETPRYAPLFTAFQGQLQVCGGYMNSVAGAYKGSFLSSCEVFDPSENNWSAAPSMVQTRCCSPMFVIHGKMLALGGTKKDGSAAGNQVEEFDPKTQKWTVKEPLKVPRKHAAAVVI